MSTILLNKTAGLSLEPLNALAHHYYQRMLGAFYQAAVENELPVALWRHPQQSAQFGLVDFDGVAQPTKIDFRNQTPGFVFSPFVNPEGRETLFLKAGLHLSPAGHTLFDQSSPFDNPLETDNKSRYLKDYHRLAHSRALLGRQWVTTQTQPYVCPETEYYTLVETAIDYIKSTGIKKVVTSRAVETSLPAVFNPLATFAELCRRYPHAFVSLVSAPTVGTWIGASPEVLLRLKDGEVYTVALAGTQPRPTDIPLSAVAWGDKEIEEQDLVSDDIRRFFRRLQLSQVIENGPYTVSAGQIVHLQTQFRVHLAEPQLSRLANQVLHNLHPTSAVCGMPKSEALDFILQHENYDRAFYSGFLGPVHLNHRSDLFVNLRCMQLKQESAILYVGGGITKDSVPQSEWTETVLKSRTLLNVLRQPELNV